MLFNYLKVAWRNIRAYKFYSFVNIIGLTIGLTCSTLIAIYIIDELSYDRFHPDAENIYRVGINGSLSGQKFNAVVSCAPMSATLVEEFPEVSESIRMHVWDNVNMSYEENAFVERYVLLADSNFFQFWNFNLIEGNPETVLKGVNKMVLSEEAAIKYFDWKGPGDTSPIGKIVNMGTGSRTCEITGIVENAPSNSHFSYDVIFSMESWEQSRQEFWVSNNFHTYFKKNPEVPIEETQLKLDGLVDKYVAPQIEQALGMDMDEFREKGDAYAYFTQAMLDVHLTSNYDGELMPNGNITYVYIFGAVAVFILILASINFMNLATARSSSRAKEVGIRKTVGASRGSLTFQFLAESILFSFIAIFPSVILIYLALPYFNSISGKELEFIVFTSPMILFGLIGLALTLGLLSGIYPAVYLTAFKPVEVLKGKVRAGLKSGGVRGTLVVFQFLIGIWLIISTVIVYRQLNMMQNRNLGFEKENVLVIDNARKLGENLQSFKEELKKYNEVLNASISNGYPSQVNGNTVFRPEGAEDQLFFVLVADHDHLATLGYEISKGRFFDKERPSDSLAIVLNQSAMDQLGWEAINGQKIWGFWNSVNGDNYEMVGVVEDFNFESLRQSIRPLAFLYSADGNFISVRLSAGDVADKVALIEEKWNEFVPEAAFEYTFLDQEFDALYRSEQRMGNLAIIFTSLAIFVACLWLFGLATFTSEQRAKEIGIRKVMGASSQRIVYLLTKEFTKLVAIAFILAIPLSYFTMDYWLQDFAFKIDIGVLSFIIGGFAALLIAWLTVGYQSYKAAATNPVNSLKSE